MYICTIDVISTGNNNVLEELMKIDTRVFGERRQGRRRGLQNVKKSNVNLSF